MTLRSATLSLRPPRSDPSYGKIAFDLLGYARQHRYRTRNLHDGYPAPPAKRPRAAEPHSDGHWGDNRWDVVVGHRGYLFVEVSGMLGVNLHFKSSKGVRQARRQIEELGGKVTQMGDTEIAGNLPLSVLDEALKLIKVSKRTPGNPSPNTRGILPRSSDANGS